MWRPPSSERTCRSGSAGHFDQDAWDVALFVDSHERPQDPRFTGNVGETRRLFHNSRWSMYGQTIAGHVLGSGLMPEGRPGEQK